MYVYDVRWVAYRIQFYLIFILYLSPDISYLILQHKYVHFAAREHIHNFSMKVHIGTVGEIIMIH